MTVLVNQNVLRFDISMDNAVSMDLLNGQYELSEVDSSLLLSKPSIALLIYHSSHVSSWTVVCDHVEILKSLEGVVELGHELMINLALDLFFSDDKSSQPIVGTFFHALHGIL